MSLCTIPPNQPSRAMSSRSSEEKLNPLVFVSEEEPKVVVVGVAIVDVLDL